MNEQETAFLNSSHLFLKLKSSSSYVNKVFQINGVVHGRVS